ncbi:sensor histidine kinase [Jatrophihabitans sp. YIM 134969]
MTPPTAASRRAAWSRRARRLLRNLRFRVTAVATVAAIVLAVSGAVVFAVLFRQSLRTSTDDALRTIASGTVSELEADAGAPRLTAVASSSRSTVLQLIGPDGTVRQTVAATTSLGPTVEAGRTTLAAAADVTAAAAGAVLVDRRGARVLLTPVALSGGTWVLLVASDLDQVEDAAHDAEATFFVVVPLVVLLIAAGAWVLSGAVLRPVERIRADAAQLRDTVTAGRVPDGRVHRPDSGDGIEALAVTLNGLLGDLTAAAERQRHLVADAGHELRTPLAVLRTELELADRDTRDTAYLRDAVRHARDEVDRLSTLAEDLLLLADAEHRVGRDAGRVSLGDVVDQSVRAHRGVAGQHGIDLQVDLVDDTRLPGEPGSLRRVVDNLLGNALRVATTRITVTVRAVPGPALELAVSDDGTGFDPDFLPHAFERFRRGDDDRTRTGSGGAGLGLAIVAAVAAAHHGTANATNTATGARVSVTLPSA